MPHTDSFAKYTNVDGETHLLNIVDTAGQEEYVSLRDQQYRTGEGFLLVYSVIDEKTFKEVEYYHDHMLRVKDCYHAPVVLVGNKSDLEQYRVVSYEDGQNLANRLGVPFFETSAKLRQNVDEAFHEIVRLIREDKNPRSRNKRSRSCSLM